MDSILKNISYYNELSENNFQTFLKIIKKTTYCIIQVNTNLKLGLKQIYYLNSFNKFETSLKEYGKNVKDNLIKYLSYLKEYLSFNKLTEERLNLILNNEINLINDNLNNEDKKYKLLIELFSNKILALENENEKSNNEKEENEINILKC